MKYTTVKLPQTLLEELKEETHTPKNSTAVIMAIQDKLQEKKRRELLKLAGKIHIEDVRHEDDRLG